MNPNPKFSHLAVYKFKAGQSGNLAGRPKSYMTVLKELGYSKPVIATMVAEIAFMPYNQVLDIVRKKEKKRLPGMPYDYYQVKGVSKCDKEPIIRRAIARAFLKAEYKGEYKYIADYLTILFGRPVPFIPEASSTETNEK